MTPSDILPIDNTLPALQVPLDSDDCELRECKSHIKFLDSCFTIVLSSALKGVPLLEAARMLAHEVENVRRTCDKLKTNYISRCADLYGAQDIDNERLKLFDRMYDEGARDAVGFVGRISSLLLLGPLPGQGGQI